MSLTVDSNDTRAVINAQYRWLKTLQLVQPNKQTPILVKVIEGNWPKGEDFDLYGWKPFQSIWPKVDRPIYTRGILLNELFVDPDTPEWDVMKEGIDKLCKYCRKNNIPFIAGYSGGKGVHVSIFFKYSSLEETYPYDVDVFKAIRIALITALAECAEVDLESIRLDRGKIIFNEASKGSQVRTFGTMRAAEQYKTHIEEISDHKPEPYELSLIFPEKIDLWEIKGTEFEKLVIEAIKKEVERATKANEYPITNVDFSGTEIMKFPCIKNLFTLELLEGRYYAGESILLICKQCGISKNETEKNMRQLFKTFPSITQAETDLRISNVLTMYHSDKNFSCRVLKDHFSKYNLCDFSKCPVKGKIEKKRAQKPETTSEFRELTVGEIKARKESFKDRRLPSVLR